MNFRKVIFGNVVINSTAANIGLALLRIFTGLSLAFSHGISKLPPSNKFIESVSNMNFPAPEFFAWMVPITEFLGGIFLAFGIFTRPVCFFIIINMFVAAFISQAGKPFGKMELALLYEFIAIAFLFIGSSKYGIDYLIYKKV